MTRTRQPGADSGKVPLPGQHLPYSRQILACFCGARVQRAAETLQVSQYGDVTPLRRVKIAFTCQDKGFGPASWLAGGPG